MSLTPQEEQMLKGCQAGQAHAQQKLYQQFYGKMMSVCLRYAKDREEAQDILQEGFIKVFASLSHFKNEGSLEGWVRRIMVNTAINHYHRYKKQQAETSLDHDLQEQYSLTHNFDDIDVIQKINYEELLLLIRSLPPAYQTVFNLYVIEGYSHKEIGEMLQINEGTSKSNLAKARMKLQKQINTLLDDNAQVRCV
ncbi:MAG: RNA polymerase sigma factor [Bacteroidetes bacterium]|nr:MAG: RNA polymerase sigma factor [Bacteroidota bacterium]